jgi:hypothetical protein
MYSLKIPKRRISVFLDFKIKTLCNISKNILALLHSKFDMLMLKYSFYIVKRRNVE